MLSRLCLGLVAILVITAVIQGSTVETYSTTGTIPDFNFVAVGDWGCTPDTTSVVAAINNLNPERVLGLGDYSYDNSPTCWYNEIAPIESKMQNPSTVALGNHETVDGSSTHLDSSGRTDFLNHFGLTNTYYSFNHKNVHFLVMDTESPYLSTSAQYTFVKNDLVQASNNSTIGWIVAYFHKPMYASPATHAALTDMRATYQPLFDQYSVDLVLQAHNHAYERTKPLHFNSVVTDNNATSYTNPSGQIYVTVGTGGKWPRNWDGINSNVVQQLDTFGYLNVDVINSGRTLDAKFYDTNGVIRDQFSITKNVMMHGSDAIPEFPYAFLIFTMAITIFLSWRFLMRVHRVKSVLVSK